MEEKDEAHAWLFDEPRDKDLNSRSVDLDRIIQGRRQRQKNWSAVKSISTWAGAITTIIVLGQLIWDIIR